MTDPVALLGMPEGDAFVPSVLVLPRGEHVLVMAGRFGAMAGLVDVELGETTPEHAARIVEGASGEHGLKPVPLHVGLHYMLRADADEQGEVWTQIRPHVEPGLWNTARLVDPLARLPGTLDRAALHEQAGTLVHPRRGVFFELLPHVAEPAFEDLVDAIRGGAMQTEEARRSRIAELVGQTADRALDEEARKRWALAMDVATLLAAQDPALDELRKGARQTSLAIRSGLAGREIPWLRVWTERQLALAVEQIMGMSQRR